MMKSLPPVLDVCCGSRMFWFDNYDERVVFVDKRQVSVKIDIGTSGTKGRKPVDVFPSIQGSYTDLPFHDETFSHIIFDPPHLASIQNSGIIALKYGVLPKCWRDEIRKGFQECFRVLKPFGTLIFKWCEVEIPLKNVLSLSEYSPLYGHRSGKKALTHWVAFIKHHKLIDNDKNTYGENLSLFM